MYLKEKKPGENDELTFVKKFPKKKLLDYVHSYNWNKSFTHF